MFLSPVRGTVKFTQQTPNITNPVIKWIMTQNPGEGTNNFRNLTKENGHV